MKTRRTEKSNGAKLSTLTEYNRIGWTLRSVYKRITRTSYRNSVTAVVSELRVFQAITGGIHRIPRVTSQQIRERA